MKKTSDQLQGLLDREEIRDLPRRYCHLIWRQDLDGWLDLFTEDGSFSSDAPGEPKAKGHAELREMMGSGLQEAKPRPFIHNHVIELLSPNEARGTCYVEVHLRQEGKRFETRGWYSDEYAKVDGEWRFKSRHMAADFFGPATEE